ncbi:MAG: hypothetical protein J6Q33_00685 [Alistipes sp.]|nr:hypothetical protein [Alistipes sp.]
MRKLYSLVSMFLVTALSFGAASCTKEKTTPVTPEPGDENTVEVGKPYAMEDFTVTLEALHSGDVLFSIEPNNKEMTYWYSLQIKEEMPETDEAIIATDIEYFNYVADYYGMTLTQLLNDNLVYGDIEWRYKSLEAHTEYVLYMYGISTTGEAQTTVNQFTFTTTKVQQLDCDFEILIGDNVTATSFSVTIIPSDDTVGYYYDVFPAAMYEEYCLSDAANLPAFIADYIVALASENSVTVPYAVGAISAFGTIAHDFTAEDGIEASNAYYVFAIGIGADGTATTEATVQMVQTARPPMNTFEVTQGNIEDDRATFYVAPDHSESYVALFELQEYFIDENGNTISDEQIMSEIIRSQGSYLGNHIYSGTSSVSECPLIPNKDYYCLVFGYFGGEITTPLTKVSFHTKEADMVDADILVTVAEVTTTEASVSFDPYVTPMPHMFNIMPYSVYREYGRNDAAIKKYNDELINQLWDPSKMSREEWLSRALETSYNSWRITDLEPNTQYIVYAVGLVPDGTYTTQAFFKEIKTKEMKEGPHVEEILFNKEGTTIAAWFYIDDETAVSKFAMSHIVNDDSVYTMSDEALLAYLQEEHETTYVNEVTNQYYFSIFDKNYENGDVIYYAGAVYDPDGNYTIIRTTYPQQ